MNLKDVLDKSAKTADIKKTGVLSAEINTNGLPTGISTGWVYFDKYFKVLKGQTNVVTGFPGSGKSEWVESLACNMIKKHGWKVLFISPEAYPVSLHLLRLVAKFANAQIGNRFDNFPKMNDQLIASWVDFLAEHIDIVDASTEEVTLEQIFTIMSFSHQLSGKKYDMVVLDPWNEMESQRPSGQTETDYIGECLKKIRKVSRRLDISFWIVAHPQKPKPKDDGTLPKLTLYDISGSAHWYNKIDNGFIVYRSYAQELPYYTKVEIKKLKMNFYGELGECWFRFQRENSDFKDLNYDPTVTVNKEDFYAF